MKIYFVGAISQKEKFGASYKTIIETLETMGAVVQHEHISTTTMDEIANESDDDRVKYYKQALRRIAQADLVVAEASFPSTINVGHEITLALEKGKPVIVLYKEGYDSFFLNGLVSDKLFMVEYTEENLAQLTKDSVEYARDQTDTRFNFFISPKHMAYLDWVAQTKRIPRSVYLRQLIEQDRDRNESYLS